MTRIKRFLTNKWLWLILVLLVLGGGYYYYQQQQGATEEYSTTNPQKLSIAQTVEVAGIIDADEKATLRFPASSRLTWVGVKEGDWVKQWQSIASVDTRTLQKQLQQDFNNFEKTWRTHDQTLDDVDYYADAGIDDEFKRIAQKSHYDLQNAAINVEIRDLAIKLSSIISPVNGLVVKIDQPHAGANISPTDTFQIVNPETVEFRSVVDEEDISLIKPGQKADLIIDSYQDNVISALVEKVDFIPSQSESGGTGYGITILFPVDNQNLQYKLGMNGTATIVIDKKDNVLAIPIDSIITRENDTYVEVLAGESIEQRLVKTGIESDDYIQITDGLSETDLVVVPNGSEE